MGFSKISFLSLRAFRALVAGSMSQQGPRGPGGVQHAHAAHTEVGEGRTLWQEVSQADLRELEGPSGPVTWRRLPK